MLHYLLRSINILGTISERIFHESRSFTVFNIRLLGALIGNEVRIFHYYTQTYHTVEALIRIHKHCVHLYYFFTLTHFAMHDS